MVDSSTRIAIAIVVAAFLIGGAIVFAVTRDTTTPAERCREQGGVPVENAYNEEQVHGNCCPPLDQIGEGVACWNA